MKKLYRLWRDKSGEGYIDVVVMVIAVMLMIALGVRVFPVFITKIQMDHFADELIREAEVSGRVGSETKERYKTLCEKTGISPNVSWSQSGKIQLNHEVTVTLTLEKDIGSFANLASFKIPLKSAATGKSEVYWK